MTGSRGYAAAIAAALLLWNPASPGRADEDAAASLDAAIRAAHALVAAERWSEGETALRRVLSEREGDAGVRARLREIEDDLQVCLFRRSAGAPDAREIFGPALKRFVPSTLEVELEYAEPSQPDWVVAEGAFAHFGVSFAGDAAIEFTPVLATPDDRCRIAVLMLCDLARGTGFAVVPYLRQRFAGTGLPASTTESVAARLSPLGLEEITRTPEGARAVPGERLLVSRVNGSLALRRGTRIVFAVTQGRTLAGVVGVIGTPIRDVKLRGRLHPAAYQRLVADRLAARFERWKTEEYDRTRELPAWTRMSATSPADEFLGMLPSDGRFLAPEQTDEIVRLVLRGDEDGVAWGEEVANLSRPVTAAYFRGLVAFALRRWSNARREFEDVLGKEPGFAPARLFRGETLARMRQAAAAREDLEAVIAAHPGAVRAYVALAGLDLDASEFDRALTRLGQASAQGGRGQELAELSRWVHRAVAGPLWPRRFRRESAHFVVESDHSEAVCAEVADLLETMQPVYAQALGAAPSAPAKSRVYVFASEDGYRRHTGELGVDSESTAGLYHTILRTLLLFVPDADAQLRATVRHEGFHQYLARSLPETPDWLNEGWAQCLQGDEEARDLDAITNAVAVPRFVGLRRLVAMDHAEFLFDAQASYAESKLLVRLLLRSRDPRFSRLLPDYLAALRAGASREEANAKVLLPVVDELERAFFDSLR